jgi:ISXO2-like transposase domain
MASPTCQKRDIVIAGSITPGDMHTNTIEGFWSLVKRGIGVVNHSVSQKYLQSYLDEYLA